MSVAQLGFQIDSSQAAGAAADLDKLTSAAARTEQAATKVSGAGTRMSRGFADLNPALDKIIGSLGRLEGIAGSIDKRLDMMSSAATRAAKANSVLDQSAVEASTSYKQLEASLNAVTAAQKKADAAQASSLAMIDKQKASIAQLRAELAKLHNTPMPHQPNMPGPANNNIPNGGQAGVGNIAAQLFDTFSTAPFMASYQVGLQQGPQFAQAFAGQKPKEALASLAAGLTAIASPVSLAAIGFTTAAAAAVSFGTSLLTAEDGTKKLDEALERHDGVMKRLEDRYGALVTAAKGYTAESAKILQFEAGSDTRALRRETKTAGKAVFDQAMPGFFSTTMNPFGTTTVDGMFQDAIVRLQKTAREGKPDFDAFYESLEKTAAIDPKFSARADELAKLVDQYRAGTKALEEMERVQNRLFNDRGPNGMLLSQGPTNQADMGNYALFQSREGVAARRRQQAVDAQIAGINARSPQERAAAARANAAAQYNNDETAAARRARIEQAGVVALTQAEKQLSDARRDRASSLDKLLTDQQTEIDLIGKTGGAAVALRKEYELTSQLRLEAARQGIEVDQNELALIKERAAALGQLADQYNQSKFNFDMKQQMSDMRLSAKDLAVVTRLRQAGLPEDLSGSNAQMIRNQMQSQEQKEAVDRFSSNLANNLIQSGGNIGEAFGKTFLAALQESATKQLTQIFQQIFTGLLGGTGASGAGIGGAVGSVAAAAMGRSANDNKSGAYSGIAGIVPVTRPPLANIPNTDIASYIAKAASARSIDPSIALRVAQSEGGLKSWNLQSTFMKNGVQEPSFGPYQLYMGGGLGNAFQKQTGLDPRLAINGPAGVDFALDNAKKSGWGAWYGAKKVGIGNWDGINSGGGASAADAVNKLAESAKAATGGLDTLGGGLGKLGQSLSTSFFPAAPTGGGGGGGGGLFGWIGGLFGGGANLSKYKGLTGLFADGTNYAPGGMAIVGERGPELVNLPQGSQVFDTNRSNRMMGNNGNAGHSTRPKLNVYVNGASGDDHVRELARQGAQEAIFQYDQSQTRGGFLDNQQKANARKG